MRAKSRKPKSDKRLDEIACILAKGVLRMRNNDLLLTSKPNEAESDLLKPLKPVNQRVSG